MAEYTTYIEVEVTVHYDYQPEEAATGYPNPYPGCDASVTLNSVELGRDGLDIHDHLGGGDQQHLMDEIMEHLTTGDR